jgi:RNA polymerase sigma factor (sigma-70 family)
MEPNTRDRSFDLESFFARHADDLFRFAVRLTGSREEAEDVAAEAFMQIARAQHTLREAGAAKTWAYRITLNLWRARRRTAKLTTLSWSSDLPDSDQSTSTQSLEVQMALLKLNPKVREAVILVKGEGLTFKEAAQVLRRPQGTVASQVKAGIERLRQELSDSCEPGEELEKVSL